MIVKPNQLQGVQATLFLISPEAALLQRYPVETETLL